MTPTQRSLALLRREGCEAGVDDVTRTSQPECKLAWHLHAMQLPAPETEYRFHDTRKWRFDFAWPDVMLAVEVEGVTHGGGRHQRVQGFERDCEKYNEATLAGWRLLRFTQAQINRGDAVSVIQRALLGASP